MSAVHVNVTTRRSTHENRQWRNFWFWFCSNRRTLSGAAEAVRRFWHRLNRRLNSPTGLRPNTAIYTVGARVRRKVVQIVAHLRPQVSFATSPLKQLPPLLGMVGVAIALPPPTITELVIDNDMFVTRLSPQLKVTYCEPR